MAGNAKKKTSFRADEAWNARLLGNGWVVGLRGIGSLVVGRRCVLAQALRVARGRRMGAIVRSMVLQSPSGCPEV